MNLRAAIEAIPSFRPTLLLLLMLLPFSPQSQAIDIQWWFRFDTSEEHPNIGGLISDASAWCSERNMPTVIKSFTVVSGTVSFLAYQGYCISFTIDCNDYPKLCNTQDKQQMCPATTKPIVLSNGVKHLTETDLSSRAASGLNFNRHYRYEPQSTPAPSYRQLWQLGHQPERIDTGTNDTIYADVMNALMNEPSMQNADLYDYTWPVNYYLIHLNNRPYYVQLNTVTGDQTLADQQANFFSEYVTSPGGTTPDQVTVTELNGDKKYFDAVNGRLMRIEFANGHSRDYNYTPSGFGDNLTITDSYGDQIQYNHLGSHHSVMIDPGGREFHYHFDLENATNPKLKVIYPDNTPATNTDNPYREYEHISAYDTTTGAPLVTNGALSKIYDNGVLTMSYEYDPVTGMPIAEEKPGGVDRNAISYVLNAQNKVTQATLTNALGKDTVYTFQTIADRQLVTQVDGLASLNCLGDSKSISYDTDGYVTSKTDRNGNITQYTRDTSGRETQRIEAFGTPEQRTIDTVWHSSNKPASITRPRSITEFTYGAYERLMQRTEIDTVTGICATDNTQPECRRTTSYTYNSLSQVLTIDGPRTDVTDVTTYTYDASHNRNSITNALGQVTNITAYDSYGNPLSITDPNGSVTSLTYDSQLRLLTRTVAFGTAEASTTTFEYDLEGKLHKIIQADGSFLQYAYDAADRLIEIIDNQNNKISYTLDNAGNRTAENIVDPGMVLVKTQTRVFDELSRLLNTVGASTQTTQYTYDLNDNPVTITEPKGGITTQSFDALDRLVQSIDPENGSLKPTSYIYDAEDNLISVTDPNSQTTSYVYNGFGDIINQTSPNTGTTSYTYDAAGNRTSQTDARGIMATYSYDALNRLTSIDYPGTAEDVSYSYDSTLSNNRGIGRLTQINDESGSTAYHYDRRGNVTQVTTTINTGSGSQTLTTGYAYNLADNLTQITYPSGRTVDYSHNLLGQVSAVHTTQSASTQALATTIAYQPFGPLRDFNYGNGLAHSRSFDQDLRLTQHSTGPGLSPVHSNTLAYDDNSNISSLTDNVDSTQSSTFDYDALNRLGGFTKNSTPACYAYDAVGNRTLASASAAQSGQTGNTLLNGLLAAYNFEEGSGSVYNDVSGSGNHSNIATHSPVRVAGRYGDGISVSSSLGQYADFGNITGWIGLNQYTFSTWILIPTQTTSWTPLFTSAFTYTPGDLVLHCTGTADCGAYHRQSSGATHANTAYSTHFGAWQHWTVTYDQGTLSYYLNGQLMASNTGVDIAMPNDSLLFGNYYNSHYPNATIDDLMLHSRVLTPAEIAQLAQATDSVLNQAGEPTAPTVTCDGGAPGDISYNYQSGNQRLADISDGSTTNYTYDANGNTTGIGGNSFTYNNANRLNQATVGTLTTDYTYNALGQRTLKTNTNETVLYVYDLNGLLIAEYDASAVLQKEYLYLGSEPLAQVDSTGNLYYYLNDHLGTPQKLMNQSQAVVWSASYTPFGEAAVNEDVDGDSALVSNNIRFPGQYYDSESGLHYNYFRYYDPATGRYITSDPIGLDGGINTYGYVGGNPISRTDPRGLDFIMVDNGGAATYVNESTWETTTVAMRSGLPGVTDPSVEGAGPTPPGIHHITQPSVTVPSDYKNGAFCDSSGNCWWIPYIPQFPTPNNRCLPSPEGTGRCGMHPDGNVPGTQGCTGLTDDDTSNMRDMIDGFGPSPTNPLPVIIFE